MTERLAGFPAHVATATEKAMITYGALITPDDPAGVQQTLEGLQQCLFSRIPDLLDPSQIKHLVVLIHRDLSGIAYINELSVRARVSPLGRSVKPGDSVYISDMTNVQEVNFGIEVADDVAVVVVASIGWKRSVYFDFGPLVNLERIGPLSQILAQQLVSLMLGVHTAQQARNRVDAMADGYQQLRTLLAETCTSEARYQEIIEAHPWMLGTIYSAVHRHKKFDDCNIPDFTARKSADSFDDIIELKQPFLECFRADGSFSSAFNDGWNQAERYIAFAREHRDYLQRQKDIRAENPRCILLMGTQWDEQQMRAVRIKESGNLSIKLMTYDQLLAQAAEALRLMRAAALPE